MSSNESSNSSDAGAIALVLEHRKMKFDHTPTTTTETDFTSEWKELAAICKGRIAILEETAALAEFLKVMERTYTNVEEFDKALFEALYQALGGDKSLEYLDNTKNTFKLKGCDIWFGRQINRKYCIGMENYGASNNSYFDHLCIAHNPRKGENQFDDITACVQLKHSESNCRYFTPNMYGSVDTPILENDHKALGQAILYNLDVWYCLARRGVAVDEIPFTILACRKHNFADNPVIAYCCVGASINIPPHVDDSYFTYSVKCFVKFEKQNDAMGIAMYIRTMRTGMERALLIAQNRAKNIPPVSLFCRELRIGRTMLPEAKLVGCPIPGALFDAETMVTISQGELFKCGPYAVEDEGENRERLIRSSKFETKWESVIAHRSLLWFGEGSCDDTKHPVLVKVSHGTVHSSLVPHLDCFVALQQLYAHAHERPVLKSAIADVLLGFALAEAGCLSTIMKDLSAQEYGPLDHSRFLNGGMKVLWDGFAALVENVLLPMAEAEINHVDIRVSENMTYNILSKHNCKESGDEKVELLLIDFESLVWGPSTRGSIYVDKPTAMNMDCIPEPRTSHNLLWWQVLWLVNCWISQDQERPRDFVKMVFRQPTIDRFNEFQRLLGDDSLRGLGTRCQVEMDSRDIQDMLRIMSEAFSSYRNDASAGHS